MRDKRLKKWEENIRKVVPYTPGEQPSQPGMIKLNTNENPYPPAPGVRKAMEEMQEERFRLYPDPTSAVLTHALAEFYHRDPEQFFVGVGSDDVLAMAFQTFFNSKKPILFPDISYSFYSGQTYSKFLIAARHWMKISESEGETTWEKTGELYFLTPMLPQVSIWNWMR